MYHYANGISGTSNAHGYRGPIVATPKPAGTFGIILLGKSTSHGWGVDDSSTIDAYIREILAQQYPGRNFDVLNLAFDGDDSWQDFERLRTDGIPLDPDMVIFNSGINDVRNARYPHLVDRDPQNPALVGGSRAAQTRAPPGRPETPDADETLPLSGTAGWNPAGMNGSVAGTERPPTVTTYPEAAEYFQRNVERIANITVPRGITPLLSTPPSSLKLPGNVFQSSGRTYWVGEAAATPCYRDELDRRLRHIADSLGSPNRVGYVSHSLPAGVFLDDCHLTSAGNRQMAADFVDTAVPFLAGAMASAPASP